MTKNMIRKTLVAGQWENKCVYLMPGDKRDWFVAGFIDPVPAHYSTFHPFGANFILSPWDETHGKIDAYDSPGSSRVRINVGCTETFPL
jgi:hypothetical protein